MIVIKTWVITLAREVTMRRTATRTAALVSFALIFFTLAPARAQEPDSYFMIASTECYKSGAVYTASVTVNNTGPDTDICEVWISVRDNQDPNSEVYLYDYWLTVEIPGYDTRTVTFPPFGNGVEYTTLYYYVSVELPGITEPEYFDDEYWGEWYW